MAYVKQEWKDEVLNGAEKYKITRSDGTILAENVSVELITQILQAGTGITAERMNHIEDGIANCAEKIHAGNHGKSGIDPITPQAIGAMIEKPAVIQLGSSNFGGAIDFNFNNSAAEFTSRIAEFTAGTVGVVGGLHITGDIDIRGNLLSPANLIPVTLKNGWRLNSEWVYAQVRCRKWGNLIELQGVVFGDTATSNIIGSIPATVCPYVISVSACLVPGDTFRPLTINSAGEIKIGSSNTTIPQWVWISAVWMSR